MSALITCAPTRYSSSMDGNCGFGFRGEREEGRNRVRVSAGGDRISLAPFFVVGPKLPPSPWSHELEPIVAGECTRRVAR
jgi:hypothetical protein